MLKFKISALLIFALILINPMIYSHQTFLNAQTGAGSEYVEQGVASWYGPGFQGRKTASGERFDTNELTAAHKTLPFNTLIKVTNLENGKSIVVRINDRGPFVRGRVIDLSNAAKKEIEMGGTARVQLEIYSEEENIDSRSDLSESSMPVNLFEEVYQYPTKVFIEYDGINKNENKDITDEEFYNIFKNFKKIKIKVLTNNPEDVNTNLYLEASEKSNLNYFDITNRIKFVKGYSVELGSFSNKSEANELIGKLEGLNFGTIFLEEVISKGHTDFKVYIGNYRTQRESNDDRKILERMNFDIKLVKIGN